MAGPRRSKMPEDGLPRRRKAAAAAKPHERKKRARADRAAAPAMTVDQEWAAGLRRSILDSCHPFQRDAVEDPGKYISLLVGRGGGKTTVMRARALLLITSESKITVAYVATSRPEARRLNWQPTLDLIEALGAKDEFEYHETRMEIRCKRTGSVYAFFGAENRREVNKLRGQPFREFQVDEAASHDVELLTYMIEESVGPRLGENDAAIVLGGTPGHELRGLFYEVTRDDGGAEARHRPYRLRDEPVYADWIGWSSHAWDMVAILALPEAVRLDEHDEERWPALLANWRRALLVKAQNRWRDSSPKWLREYRGRWAADGTTMIYQYRARLHGDDAAAAGVADGALWNRWEPFGNEKLEGVAMLETALARVRERTGFDDLLCGYGIDLGARDPFALSIYAFSPADTLRRLWHVFSFERVRMYNRAIAELLIGKECAARAFAGEVFDVDQLGGLFGVTGWPAAIVADHSGNGQAILDDLEKTYAIRIKPANRKNKRGSWEVFNGHLFDGRMVILADTPLEAQLASLQFKVNEYGIPDENKADPNHSADSALYIVIEITPMFTAAADPAAEARERERERDRAAAPAAKRDRAEDWKPRRPGSRARGEFGALLSRDNFNHLDEWGNS